MKIGAMELRIGFLHDSGERWLHVDWHCGSRTILSVYTIADALFIVTAKSVRVFPHKHFSLLGVFMYYSRYCSCYWYDGPHFHAVDKLTNGELLTVTNGWEIDYQYYGRIGEVITLVQRLPRRFRRWLNSIADDRAAVK